MIIIDSITTNDFIFLVSLIALAIVLDLFTKPPHTNGLAKNWANIVAAALPLVLGAVQAGMASRQKKQRPIMGIPSAMQKQMENQARLAAMEKAPGYDAMLNQIRQQGAAATQNIKEITGGTAGAAGAVTDIYAKELGALQGMQGAQEQFRLQQQQALNQALGQMAQFQERAWDYNVNQPYQQSMAAKSALTNAAMSNILGGVTGALGTYQANKDKKQLMSMLNAALNKKNNSGGENAPIVTNYSKDTKELEAMLANKLLPDDKWYQPAIIPTDLFNEPVTDNMFLRQFNPNIPLDK